MTEQHRNQDEVSAVRERYRRRKSASVQSLYDPLRASVYMDQQERERILIERILRPHLSPLQNKRLLEIGCGNGLNLLNLLRLGFRPENLVANELLAERIRVARDLLPQKVSILEGDACKLSLPADSFDAVLQSTVFTSVLDDGYQKQLAQTIWRLVKPGGGVIWYDFIYDNPKNPDVRGVPLRRIRKLFPHSDVESWRVTLAPPVARGVTALHPGLYGLFNSIPLLRSHLLCWIPKS